MSDSNFPTVLRADGVIDLTGGLAREPVDERPTGRPSGDAWVVDRDRRSLLPPPVPGAAAAQEADSPSPDDIHREIADHFALGDYAAALHSAELQLGLDPDDESARHYADASRARLEIRHTTRIGSLEYVFNLAVPAAKVKWLGLDPQAAFLLSLVDGQTTVAEVLELCQLGRLEALRVFTELLEAKAILRVA
ncbi:MAG: hypothetical protein DRH23_09300 [Deltaproteobacteria bacterium]|nr:hypothetical protein [Deltaproteobacteria bacterium]MBW2403925.1 hypothetical protein [Deltaproteobacteria bacterium]MBW2547056.1 hypothetical protein [Deltaproteobacteria bacterium]MBW2717039.1 hypothetical protein [Deltaproteobacteria bacterium]RLB48127.1 MAG: hypothetical protein DRH23_09300 [Deltaproteobacteria bacterium]